MVDAKGHSVEGGHGIVYDAEIRFGSGRKKKVAAKRFKSAEEVLGRITGDTLNTRPWVSDRYVRLIASNPYARARVDKWRKMISRLQSAGCAIAKMDFVEYQGEYWLVSPAYTRGGRSIVGETYWKTNLAEKKIVWKDMAKMINAGYYTSDVKDSYFFYPTRYGKRPVIIDFDQIRAVDRKGDFFRHIVGQLEGDTKQEQIELAKTMYSGLNGRNRRAFLNRMSEDIFRELTNRERRHPTVAQEIEIFERRESRKQEIRRNKRRKA